MIYTTQFYSGNLKVKDSLCLVKERNVQFLVDRMVRLLIFKTQEKV